MTVAYTPKDAVLDVVAVALILAPEPVTTPIGISLLMRKRGSDANQPTKPLHNYPEYVYKVEEIRGRTITYEVRTMHPGQLPHPELNRPDIKIKPREEFILGRKPAEKSADRPSSSRLPADVKVHHTIIKPPRTTKQGPPVFIPGETIHHELRPLSSPAPVFRKSAPEISVHHTIESSPGYIMAQSRGASPQQKPQIIHHTLKDAPAAQIGNPLRIEKPQRIIEHHTLNTNPSLPGKGPLIPPPPTRKGTISNRNSEPDIRRR